LSPKVHLVKAMVFPVVMYRYESWTVKKAEHRRIDAFELWCWRRLLRVPWTARRFNQSIIKISPGCSLEGLILKLKLQYFGHLMRRVDSLERPWCWERLKARGEGDDRKSVGWVESWTHWTWVWAGSRSGWWTGNAGMWDECSCMVVWSFFVDILLNISFSITWCFDFIYLCSFKHSYSKYKIPYHEIQNFRCHWKSIDIYFHDKLLLSPTN